MNMTDKNRTQPFDSDPDYLDLVFEFLAARARRIGAERRLEEDSHDLPLWHHHRTLGRLERVSEEETRRQIDALCAEEKRLREHLDARIRAHRADTNRQPLGIDVLAEESGLTADEKMILLACTAMAVSSEVGRQIAEGVGGNVFSRMEVETAIKLLEPRGTADWLRLRKLFRRNGALVRRKLIAVEFPSTTYAPTDVLSASVEITNKAFGRITGIPQDDEDPETPESRR